jgi:N12 class adenine-specific DNA methylase
MLNELGPFALLMHYFIENISKFKKLGISREEFDRFKRLVLSTITQTISGYHQDQQRKRRALEMYDEIYNISIRNDHQFPIGTPTISEVSHNYRWDRMKDRLVG